MPGKYFVMHKAIVYPLLNWKFILKGNFTGYDFPLCTLTLEPLSFASIEGVSNHRAKQMKTTLLEFHHSETTTMPFQATFLTANGYTWVFMMSVFQKGKSRKAMFFWNLQVVMFFQVFPLRIQWAWFSPCHTPLKTLGQFSALLTFVPENRRGFLDSKQVRVRTTPKRKRVQWTRTDLLLPCLASG